MTVPSTGPAATSPRTSFPCRRMRPPHPLASHHAHPLRRAAALLLAALALAGCATRPVNPPMERYDASKIYRVERLSATAEDNATLVLLAFSGGGTRAAAFSYGVLETLRDMQSTTKSGRQIRVLDAIWKIVGFAST